MGALTVTKLTLASAVNNNGTFTVSYPAGMTQARLIGATGGRMIVDNDVAYAQGAGGFTAVFGASNITVTNTTGLTLAAGSAILISFGQDTRAGSGVYNPPVMQAGPVALTAATGTASDTIADVTGTFSQSILNNNFKSLSEKLNAVIAALENAGLTN